MQVLRVCISVVHLHVNPSMVYVRNAMAAIWRPAKMLKSEKLSESWLPSQSVSLVPS